MRPYSLCEGHALCCTSSSPYLESQAQPCWEEGREHSGVICLWLGPSELVRGSHVAAPFSHLTLWRLVCHPAQFFPFIAS